MPASTEELIAINSLLIKREAAFAHVHGLESQIEALLGGDQYQFPFAPPEVTIPSTIRKKQSKAKRTKQTSHAPKLRRLAEHEVAYRLTWTDKGQIATNEVTDLRSIDALIQDSLPAQKLQKVETLDLSAQPIDTLYSQP